MGHTIIDELFVRIGLDAKGFDKENAKVLAGWKKGKDSAKDSLGVIEQSAKKTADYLASLKTEVIGLFLAFAGARSLTGFVMDTINATAQVGRLSSVMGVNINTLNAWGDAFKSVGGDVGDAARVFGTITGMIAEFKLNPGAVVNDGSLQRLGFTSIKEMEDPEEVLLKLADNFQKRMAEADKSNDPKSARIEQEAIFRKLVKDKFGLTDNDISLIEQGREAINKQVDAFKKLDEVTQADTKAAQDFDAALTHLEKTLTGITRGPLMDIIRQLDVLAQYVGGDKDKMDPTNPDDVNDTGPTVFGFINGLANWSVGRAWNDDRDGWASWAHGRRSTDNGDGEEVSVPSNAPSNAPSGSTKSRESRAYWRNRIAQEADRQGLSPQERATIIAIAEHESGFDPDVNGPVIQKGTHKGDRPHGLFQFMAKSSQGWNRFDREQQVEHGVAEFKRYARAHGVNGALAIWMSGNPKAGQPGGPNPNDGYISTSKFIRDVTALAGKYYRFTTVPTAQAAEAPRQGPAERRPSPAHPTPQRTVRFAINPAPARHRDRPAAQRALDNAKTRDALVEAAKAHGYNVHSARQQQATHNTTNHVTHNTHVAVTVQGDAKHPHATGKAIADSVHHRLKRHQLATHANTGLN